MNQPKHRYYPVFLDLRDRWVLVIGGGAVAEEKVTGLLDAGARVRVIAARANATVQGLAARGALEYLARPWRPSDLDGVFMIFAERAGARANRAIFDAADRRGIPVNVQDDTPCCSFIAASLVRRGDLTVAISTAGKAPALAVRLRQELEQRLGDHHARFLDLCGRMRAPLLARFPDFETRKQLWYRLVDSDALDHLAAGDEARALRRMVDILGVQPTPEHGTTSLAVAS